MFKTITCGILLHFKSKNQIQNHLQLDLHLLIDLLLVTLININFVTFLTMVS